MFVQARLYGVVHVAARETLDAEKDLADTTHLDLLGALGDPVTTVVAVDVLCRTKNV